MENVSLPRWTCDFTPSLVYTSVPFSTSHSVWKTILVYVEWLPWSAWYVSLSFDMLYIVKAISVQFCKIYHQE